MSVRVRELGGDELERLAEAWLELDGWTVHRAAPGVRRLPGGKTLSYRHDIFGVFDLIAFRRSDGYFHSEMWALQTTTVTNRAHRRRKIEALAATHPFPTAWRISVVHAFRDGPLNTWNFYVEDFPGPGLLWTRATYAVDLLALRAHRKREAAKAKEERVCACGATHGMRQGHAIGCPGGELR